MRYLEMRIGELAGPAVIGRPSNDRKFDRDQTFDLASIDPATLHNFRQMAKRPEVVEQVIVESSDESPSRSWR